MSGGAQEAIMESATRLTPMVGNIVFVLIRRPTHA